MLKLKPFCFFYSTARQLCSPRLGSHWHLLIAVKPICILLMIFSCLMLHYIFVGAGRRFGRGDPSSLGVRSGDERGRRRLRCLHQGRFSQASHRVFGEDRVLMLEVLLSWCFLVFFIVNKFSRMLLFNTSITMFYKNFI